MTRSTDDIVSVPNRYPTASIFIDESGSRASGNEFFVVAAVKVREPGKLARELVAVRERCGFSGEFKFAEITRRSVPVYGEMIEALHESDATIGTAVVSAVALDSRTNDLLQVADMVAGAIRHERQLLLNPRATRSNKGKVALQLARTFSRPALTNGRDGRLNIVTFRGQGAPGSGARTVRTGHSRGRRRAG